MMEENDMRAGEFVLPVEEVELEVKPSEIGAFLGSYTLSGPEGQQYKIEVGSERTKVCGDNACSFLEGEEAEALNSWLDKLTKPRSEGGDLESRE